MIVWTCMTEGCSERGLDFVTTEEPKDYRAAFPKCFACGLDLSRVPDKIVEAREEESKQGKKLVGYIDFRDGSFRKAEGETVDVSAQASEPQRAHDGGHLPGQCPTCDRIRAEREAMRTRIMSIQPLPTTAQANMTPKTAKHATKQEIRDLAEKIKQDEKLAIDCLMTVFKEQTAVEQQAHSADTRNGRGFSKFDAELLTSFAKQFKAKGWLSPRQKFITRKRMVKYAAQLVKLGYKVTA